MHSSLCWLQHYPSLDIQDGLAGRILLNTVLMGLTAATGLATATFLTAGAGFVVLLAGAGAFFAVAMMNLSSSMV